MTDRAQEQTDKDRHRNNFDLIRLAAAIQVVGPHYFSHFNLAPTPASAAILEVLSWFPGVPIFFIISGFLVSQSYATSRSLADYARKRFLRLYPALWVCLAISLVLVSASGYWAAHDLQPLRFFPWLLSEILFGHVYSSSVFAGYGTGVLNGSLWTITVEIQFYVVLPLIFAVSAYCSKKSGQKFVGDILLILAGLASLLIGRLALEGPYLAQLVLAQTVIPFFYYFALGMLAQRNIAFIRKQLQGKFLYFLIAYILFCLVYPGIGDMFLRRYDPLAGLWLAALVISAAYTGVGLSGTLLRGNDISYGIYIYHMVAANFLIAILGRSWSSAAISFAVTIAAAILSWHVVERPALRLKPRPAPLAYEPDAHQSLH